MTSRRFTALIIMVCAIGMIAGIVVSMNACAYGEFAKPVCRHNALFAAATWGDIKGDNVKVVLGPTDRINKTTGKVYWHAQAQAFVNGQWEWLQVCADNTICIGDREAFYPDRRMTVVQFMNWIASENPVLIRGIY